MIYEIIITLIVVPLFVFSRLTFMANPMPGIIEDTIIATTALFLVLFLAGKAWGITDEQGKSQEVFN